MSNLEARAIVNTIIYDVEKRMDCLDTGTLQEVAQELLVIEPGEEKMLLVFKYPLIYTVNQILGRRETGSN
jgi:hypothetical protein